MKGATAFLALWNGIADAARQPEYEAWHTFEHVPERVGLPGFLAARRYRGTPSGNTAPPYFTLYWLEASGALDTPEYRGVFAAPTPWTARMRTQLTQFLRMPCRLEGSHGVSTASRLVTMQLRPLADGLAAELDAHLASLVAQGALVCAHWGSSVDSSAIPIANQSGGNPPRPGDLVVLLQGLDGAALQAQAGDLLHALSPWCEALRAPESFELLTEVRRDALAMPATIGRPAPRNDLYDRFATGDKP